MKMVFKPLDEQQRLLVYQEALRTFAKLHQHDLDQNRITASQKYFECGLCFHIEQAIKTLGYRYNTKRSHQYDINLTSENFPELFKYKPKTNWREDGFATDYWWSPININGRKRRYNILLKLVKGKWQT